MSGIWQGDIFIQTMIELTIEDMRKNPYLINHMLEDLLTNKYVKEKYGEKQVKSCKEFLASNQIDIYCRPRDDRDRLPNITIEIGSGPEKPELKTMGDLSSDVIVLSPSKINKPIPFIIKPFIPTGYNQKNGELFVDTKINLNKVSSGMVLVNPINGIGYEIKGLTPNGLQMEPGQEIIASELAIVPKNQTYRARIQHAWFEETYTISCNAHGDPQNVMWLWSIAKYGILRYRESLLEANGFTESVVNSNGGPDNNTAWTTPGGEKAYTRTIQITGTVENSWISQPHRIIESIEFKSPASIATGGIQIISNLNTPSFIDETEELWTTIEDDDENE